MGFTAGTGSGIQARRILQGDLFNPENRLYRQWLYGSEQTVLADGRFVVSEDNDPVRLQSVLGYSPTHIIMLTTTSGSKLGRRGFCVMQHDGNLVLYDVNNRAAFTSGTENHPGSRLVVQNDGNVVILGPDGAVLWETHTAE